MPKLADNVNPPPSGPRPPAPPAPPRRLDPAILILPSAGAAEVYPGQRRRELAALRRDAAISLLLECPEECSENYPVRPPCGECWTCLVDKFLRGVGLRR